MKSMLYFMFIATPPRSSRQQRRLYCVIGISVVGQWHRATARTRVCKGPLEFSSVSALSAFDQRLYFLVVIGGMGWRLTSIFAAIPLTGSYEGTARTRTDGSRAPERRSSLAKEDYFP